VLIKHIHFHYQLQGHNRPFTLSYIFSYSSLLTVHFLLIYYHATYACLVLCTSSLLRPGCAKLRRFFRYTGEILAGCSSQCHQWLIWLTVGKQTRVKVRHLNHWGTGCSLCDTAIICFAGVIQKPISTTVQQPIKRWSMVPQMKHMNHTR